jgi:hypothetical protein
MKNETIDIKYLNIPNICFSLTEKNDEREEKFIKQRMERGFDDSETWGLDHTIASFIIPRLERYQELANERLDRDKEQVQDVDTLLEAMKLIEKDGGIHDWNKKEEETVMKGLALFPKVLLQLWW